MSRFRHDPDTGLYLPRERRIEAAPPNLCSMSAPQQALLMRSNAGDTDPYWSSVTLLLNFDGAQDSTTMTDSSSYAHTVTAVGDAKIKTDGAQKFTGGVLLLDGTGDYLTVPEHAGFGFGTATDYTIEAFIYPTTATVERDIIDTRKSADSNPKSLVYYLSGSNKLAMYNSSTVYGDSGSSFGTSNWYHVAWTRSGTTTRGFRDGSQEYSTTASLDTRTTRPLVIGGNFAFGGLFTGRMKCLRITKGVARYTGTYTVPSSKFPTS